MSHLDQEQLEVAAKDPSVHAEHLAGCADCRRGVSLARGRQKLMRGMKPYTLSDMAFRRVEARLEEQVREGLPASGMATGWWRWLGFGAAAVAATALALMFITREPVTDSVVKLPTPQPSVAIAAFRPLTVIRAAKAQAKLEPAEWRDVKPGDVLQSGEAVSADSVTLSDEKAEWAFVASGSLSLGGAASITLGAGEVNAKVKAQVEVLASTRRIIANEATFQVTRVGAEVVVTVSEGEVQVVDTTTGQRRTVKAVRAMRWSDGSVDGREEKVELGVAFAPVVPPPPWVPFDASSLTAGTMVSLDGQQVGTAPFLELVTSGKRRLGLTPPNGALVESWIDLVGGESYIPKVELPAVVNDGPEPDAAALARVMTELKRQTPKLSACYEKWLKANPTASGEVVLELTVSAQGRVKKARLPDGAKTISAASAECLVTTAKTLVLPPLGVEATLEQPLVLRPPGR